ncbi:MAG: CinA family nicotinamide mononucleotide deamidase-related protein [Planctomycetota bacterium]|nr:CinA family nicotinamide mononucleotide deamidase-related protein [Planctomycetota bacterium]
MLAEIISIGDELTSGQRLDTNSQWLSTQLGELGIRTMYHTTVADDLAANVAIFRAAIDRADLIISTGGLGPTADDLTRQAVADAAGVELYLDDEALRQIEQLFSRRGRPMPERNRSQAFFPVGSRVIPNPEGTAPGIDLSIMRPGRSLCRIIALPGVPAELKEMWRASVEPVIRSEISPGRVIRHRRIKCFGVGESDLEAMLPDLIRRGREPQVGITVHQATITLRITAEGCSDEECQACMAPTIATIHECLGKLAFGVEDEELEHVVLRLLQERGESLATAEWGTGGLMAEWLGEVATSAPVFQGSFTVANEAAVYNTLKLVLDLDEQALQTITADAKSTTEKLAQAAKAQFGTSYGLAVGGFPASTVAGTEPPKVWLALASDSGTLIIAVGVAGHSAIIKSRTAKQALNMLRLTLLKKS